MTYSYDIFDTCLVRSCGDPMTVFDLLARRVLGLKESDNALWMDFAMERRYAEVRARERLIRGEKEEVTLAEIYDECHFAAFTNMSKSEIMQIELDIEAEVLTPVYSVKKEIADLQAKGERVLFISDMYLPEDFLRQVLKQNGLLTEGDKLYVSSSCMKTKSSGNLFRHVQQLLNLNYRQWTHKGDNKYSDYQVPRRLGIRAKLIRHHYTYYERLLTDDTPITADTSLRLMAGISRAIRLQQPDTPQLKFAADFIAPLYIPFVLWILNDAARRGIRQLFFLARDGYIMYIIAQCFAERFPQIQLKYAYVSRKSLYLPGLPNASAQSVRSLFITLNGMTPRDIIERLQLTETQLPDEMLNLGAEEFINRLFEDNKLSELVRQKYEEQKALCQLYLRQEGLSQPDSAIVDLRGTRQCYASINALLQSMGCESVFGYYLEVIVSRFPAKGYRALSYEGFPFGKTYNLPLLPPELFEQYFSATDHESTRGYRKDETGKVVPVLENNTPELIHRKEIFSTNAEVCRQYANLFRSMVDSDDFNFMCVGALKVCRSFYQAPSKDFLKALENLSFSDSAVRKNSILTRSSVLHIIRHRHQILWWWASMVYNSRFPQLFTMLLRIAHIVKRDLKYIHS